MPQLRLESPLSLLELLRASHTLGLVLGPPELSLGVGLRQLALNVSLAFGLLLDLLADVVQVVLQVAELAQEGGALLEDTREVGFVSYRMKLLSCGNLMVCFYMEI